MTQTEISFEAKTQNERLLEYLETHPITGINPLESWEGLGIYRLSARCFDLKKKGYNIVTEDCDVQNRFGEWVRVALYKLRVS